MKYALYAVAFLFGVGWDYLPAWAIALLVTWGIFALYVETRD